MEICKNCKIENDENSLKCTMCNYPLGGTKQEQASFIAKQIMDKSDVLESFKKLKNARIMLFLVTAYLFISPLILILLNGVTLVLIISSVVSALIGIVFLIFAFLSYKRPKLSLIVPLVLISVYYLILLVIAPYDLFWRGILWKIVVIVGLGYGYISVKKSDRVLKENKYLASLVGFDKVK